MEKVGRRKQSLWTGSVSTEQASFVPTETISVGTKPFESPAWTEVHSLPQFCFCLDVYNSSAPGDGWVLSFLVHPHGVLAERRSVSAGRSVCSLLIHFYPILTSWLTHPPFSVLRTEFRLCSLSMGILSSTAVPLSSQIKWVGVQYPKLQGNVRDVMDHRDKGPV